MLSQTRADARQNDAWGIMSTGAHAVDGLPAEGLCVEAGAAVPHLAPHAPCGTNLLLQPLHALAGGMLLGAEASFPAGKPAAGDWRGQRAATEESSAALLHSACREAQVWAAARTPLVGLPGGLRVSVCVPAAVIGGRALLARTQSALEQSDLMPELLEVAIMEHAMGTEAQEMLLAVSALRDMGTGVVLDQFTGGGNGLRMLRRLPVTSIWLAPALTMDMAYHREARAAVAAVITFAHALDASVVARGVVNPVQRAILADLGCDGGQGPLFGGPMEACIFRHALTGGLDD
jgi:EAL domain-containing protein (putative c-di-GMP-specific phosphodiesterase class I)